MESMTGSVGARIAARMAGLLLVAVGGFFLLQEVFGLRALDRAWQFYVIAPGLILLVGSVSLREPLGQALAITGGIITGTGLLLTYHELYHAYATWSYTWALLVPGSAGLGQLIYGLARRRPDDVRRGATLAGAGVAIAAALGIFLNLIGGGLFIRFSAWPVIPIAIGIGLLVYSMLHTRRDAPAGER